MTHNASVQYEKLSISKSMTPCQGIPQAPLELDRHPNESLQHLLSRHESIFFDYASNELIALKSNQTFTFDKHESQEMLTLPTQCYAVDFNDEFVTISLLK